MKPQLEVCNLQEPIAPCQAADTKWPVVIAGIAIISILVYGVTGHDGD